MPPCLAGNSHDSPAAFRGGRRGAAASARTSRTHSGAPAPERDVRASSASARAASVRIARAAPRAKTASAYNGRRAHPAPASAKSAAANAAAGYASHAGAAAKPAAIPEIRRNAAAGTGLSSAQPRIAVPVRANGNFNPTRCGRARGTGPPRTRARSPRSRSLRGRRSSARLSLRANTRAPTGRAPPVRGAGDCARRP